MDRVRYCMFIGISGALSLAGLVLVKLFLEKTVLRTYVCEYKLNAYASEFIVE